MVSPVREAEVGVLLDMDNGQLNFSVNGLNVPDAIKAEEIKSGPIYPAFSFFNSEI